MFSVIHFLTYLIWQIGAVGQPVLTPVTPVGTEGEPLTLTCTVSNDNVTHIAWTNGNTIFLVQSGSPTPNCNTEGIIPGVTISCPGNRIYTVTISSVTRQHNGDIWKCTEYTGGGINDSEEVSIQVIGKVLIGKV